MCYYGYQSSAYAIIFSFNYCILLFENGLISNTLITQLEQRLNRVFCQSFARVIITFMLPIQ